MVRRLEAQSAHILTDAQWKNHNGNWDSSAMLGDMAAGVFLDDRAMYERGKSMRHPERQRVRERESKDLPAGGSQHGFHLRAPL